PEGVPDGPGQQRRGPAGSGPRRRRGSRYRHGEARTGLSRRGAPRERGVRRAGGGVQRGRRVRHDQGGGRERVDRRARGGPGEPSRDAAGRGRPDHHVPREGDRQVAGMKDERSQQLMERAQRVIPGGVNSPVRAFKAVGGRPLVIQRGHGSKVVDADGNVYIDYVMAYGPLILGHAHPKVVEAMEKAARDGTGFGATTEREVLLAEKIVQAVPGVEKVRLVNSGTEATMSALRLARAATGRRRAVKFAGCYHGHVDALLAQSGSGLSTLGIPSTPGVVPETARDTLVLPYNDLQAVEQAFSQYGDEIACVIVEPVAANMGVVPPAPGFLQGLREVTRRYGSLLIFDEVITGFRLGLAGAQGYYGVVPDLTCMGK